ncbi:MAG TPA: TonB-dependent receptor [Longimicrobiales bacterium]|nr:TonB-dependent receptor [Longimicrobiales bacterium]
MRRLIWLGGAAALSAGAAANLTAQVAGGAEPQALAAAHAALEQCAAGSAGDAAAKRVADEAEASFRSLVRDDDRNVAARVGLAQVLVRCQLHHAGVPTVMALIADAEAQLQAALAVEPEHWNARFTLAMLLKNMPAMLGRGPDATREFERLIAHQPRDDVAPQHALPFVHLGDLHTASGRSAAAVQTWRRGLALLPTHPELRARLEAAGAPLVPDSSWLSTPDAAASDLAPVYAFAPLRAEAANHQFQEVRASTTLRRMDVYTMPGGTAEMLQALQAMPGATRAGDGAELYIRGGDPAETPIFFDGGRLAFTGRWESLQGASMGVVDATILRRAYFSSGGFSARYGNALSGIVDVETEGRPAATSVRAGANMVQAGGSVRTAMGDKTGAWATLGATDTRLLNRMTGEAARYTRAPQSVQGVAGVTFDPLPGVELRTTVLSVADRYGRLVEMHGHAGEFASSSIMQHAALSARAVSPDGRRGISAALTASRRDGGMSFGVLDRQREDVAGGGRVDLDAVAFRSTRVRAGVELTRFTASTSGAVPTTASLAPGAPSMALAAEQEDALHAGAYLETEHEPFPGLALVAGLRVDALPGDDMTAADPRVALAWTSGDWTLRAGGGVFHQGSWRARYRVPDAGQPGGTPRRAEHLVAGVERGGMLSLRAEAYVKQYSEYAATGAGPQAVAGTNTGLDAMARWSPAGGLNGWVSYSLLRGRVELEGGDVVPSTLDVTHSFTSVARMPVGESWEVGATARYATGKPFTPVVHAGSGVAGTAGVPTYGEINGDRLPDYRRLDARVTRYFNIGGRRLALGYVEMLNLLDRANVMSYTWGPDDGRRVPVNSVFGHRVFVLGAEFQFQ